MTHAPGRKEQARTHLVDERIGTGQLDGARAVRRHAHALGARSAASTRWARVTKRVQAGGVSRPERPLRAWMRALRCGATIPQQTWVDPTLHAWPLARRSWSAHSIQIPADDRPARSRRSSGSESGFSAGPASSEPPRAFSGAFARRRDPPRESGPRSCSSTRDPRAHHPRRHDQR